MTEAEEWGTDYLEPQAPKRRISKWALGCSAGCFVFVVVFGVASFFAARYLSDPDVHWPAVAEVLPFDERPKLEILGSPRFGGTRIWGMRAGDDGLTGVLASAKSGGAEALRDWMKDPNNLEHSVNRKAVVTEAGKISIQGRALDCTRFYSDDTKEHVVGMALDLTRPADAPGFLVLQLNCNDPERGMDDADAELFLRPFHVGPDR